MITHIKEDNRNIRIVTQQYEVETYVAIYENDNGDFIYQAYIDMPEEEYHKWLREKYKTSLID